MRLFLFALRFLSAVPLSSFRTVSPTNSLDTPCAHRYSTCPFSKFYLRIQRFHSFLLFSLRRQWSLRSFSSVNFPFVTHGEGNSCFGLTLTSFSFNVKYPLSLSLSNCIVIPLISKRSFELTFRGSRIVVHVVIFVLSFSLLLPLDGPRGHGIRIRSLYR